MSALLELSGVTRRFGGLVAVNEMSFRLDAGEVLGLIGPNGAGKTTLFNLVNGYHRPSHGRIDFEGRRLDGLAPHEACRRGLARTFQVVKPLPRLTVLENVMVSAFVRGPQRAAAQATAEEVVTFTGLEPWRDAPAGGLPLGLRKRLEMARALATRPKLLLLDENFAGLNPSEVEKTIELVRRIHAGGVSLLIIEHNMRVIMAVSHRVVCMSYGQKLAEGTPEEIARHPAVIEAYLGKAAGA